MVGFINIDCFTIRNNTDVFKSINSISLTKFLEISQDWRWSARPGIRDISTTEGGCSRIKEEGERQCRRANREIIKQVEQGFSVFELDTEVRKTA